jgi:MerR family regulatory protein
MRIGELAQRAGVSTKALRYYEQLGLVTPGCRPNGYRDHDECPASLATYRHSIAEFDRVIVSLTARRDLLVLRARRRRGPILQIGDPRDD